MTTQKEKPTPGCYGYDGKTCSGSKTCPICLRTARVGMPVSGKEK